MNTLIIFALAVATAQAGYLGLGGLGVARSGVIASHGLVGGHLASPLLRTGVVGAPLAAHGLVGTAGLVGTTGLVRTGGIIGTGGLYGGGVYGGGVYGGGIHGGGVYGAGLLGARSVLAGPALGARVW